MSDSERSKNPFDLVLDLTFFGPIGFAVNYRKVVPDLADKGREFIDQRVNNARFVGRFAVSQSQDAGAAVTRLFGRDTPASESQRIDDTRIDDTPVPVEEHIPVRLEDVADEGLDTVTWDSVGEDELAIPSYASLAASQVVARLEGLTSDELEAVRRYEVAHRARKTVLGRIAQLQRS